MTSPRDIAGLYRSRPVTAPHTFTDWAEGPACDSDGWCYAVNMARHGTIGRVRDDGTTEIFLVLPDGRVGNGIRFDRSAATMYVADWIGHAILSIDMITRSVTVWATDPRLHQPNDIAICADGTLFASDPDFDAQMGQIWRIDTDATMTLLETGMSTTNGIEVSPDQTTLYVNESHSRVLWAYRLGSDGSISGKREMHRFDRGMPDGMRCDVDGVLFVALNGAGVVAQVSPDGELLREIAISGADCSNVAFGGDDGRTCYVTVADTGTLDSFRVERPGHSWQLTQTPNRDVIGGSS